MREWLERIDADLFGIADRLRAIDPAYRVVRNHRLGRFELHAEGGREGEDALLCVFPFATLDARAVTHARRTRTERVLRVLRERGERAL